MRAVHRKSEIYAVQLLALSAASEYKRHTFVKAASTCDPVREQAKLKIHELDGRDLVVDEGRKFFVSLSYRSSYPGLNTGSKNGDSGRHGALRGEICLSPSDLRA